MTKRKLPPGTWELRKDPFGVKSGRSHWESPAMGDSWCNKAIKRLTVPGIYFNYKGNKLMARKRYGWTAESDRVWQLWESCKNQQKRENCLAYVKILCHVD